MPKYERPTNELVLYWAQEHLVGFEPFHASAVVEWFQHRYPLLSPRTVAMYLEGMSVNNGSHRRNHPHIRRSASWDCFLKIAPRTYRRYDPRIDPPPTYG